MAAAASTDAPAAAPRRSARAPGLGLGTFLMTAPGLAVIALFFFAPLYYIVLFSIGERTFAARPALAEINGELTSFSLDLWESLLGQQVALEVLGSEIAMPTWLMGLILLTLFGLAVFGGSLPHGGWVVGGSLVLLVLPFMTIPAGNNLLRLAKITADDTYLNLFFKSISMAMTSSLLAVLVAFPIAYYLAFCVGRSKLTWLLIVITPFLTSFLLRVLSWKVILGDQGLINSGLFSLGVRDEGNPLSFLIYSQFTVIVVLLYAWVPFVVLPIFISLEGIDRRLHEAATDLGASRLHAFRRITLPMAAPGLVAAFLFVFIPSTGEFLTPTLVGGTQGFMFGNAITNQFVGGTNDWQLGSTLALFLLAVVMLLTVTTARFLRNAGGAAA